MQSISGLIKSNVVYAVGSAANSAALFLLIPYFVNTFSPAEYGAWSILEIVILLINIFMLAGMDIGLMREYWFLDNDQERRRLVGTVLVAVVLIGVLVIVLITGVFSILSRFSVFKGWQKDFPPGSIFFIVTISFSEAIFNLILSLFRIREEAIWYVTISVGRMLVFLGGAVAGVHILGGLNGALAGRLLAGILGVVVAFGLARNNIRLAFNWPWLRKVLAYSLPLVPTSLTSYILLASDRFVLQYFSTIEIVAIYTFAYKIAATLDILVIRPYATDWAARRFKISAEANAGIKYAGALEFYLFVASGFTLAVISMTPLIYNWIAPPPYLEGANFVPVLLLAYLIYGLSYPLNVGIMLKDRTAYLPLIGGVSAVVCMILNIWLIPHYGMLGAAWATLLAYLVWTAGISLFSLRLYPIAYPLRDIMFIVLVIMIGGLGLWGIEHVWDSHRILLSAIIKIGWITGLFGCLGYFLWVRRMKPIPVLLDKIREAGSKQ